MKSKLHLLILLFTLFAVLGCDENRESPTAPLPPCLLVDPPGIAFTSIPPAGSSERVSGRVDFLNPACETANYRVALYILVPRFSATTFICKPFQNSPLTTIDPEGSWSAQYATGGLDTSATQFHAFLVTSDFSGPCFTKTLPTVDDLTVLAAISVNR